MNNQFFQRTMIAVCGIMIGLLLFSAESRADGGTVSAYFGTNTTTTISGDKNTATASGNGTGGTVTCGGTNLVNGTTPGVTYTSNNNRDIVVTPASGYQIAWVKTWRSGQSWSSENVDTPATGSTTFSVNVKNGRTWKIAVMFEPTATMFNVSYSIAADNPAGTNCNTTASVTPASPQTVALNANPSFTITNSNTACQLDTVWFDTSGPVVWTTNGIVGNVYTTPDITKNVEFQIRFKGHSYTIDSSLDATGDVTCGSISPPTQVYAAGANQMFTIIKNLGCGVASVLVDGTDVTTAVTAASNTYTFTNIQANHTIVVKFVRTAITTGSTYCQVPSFMKGQSSLKPNVLIIFDTSGSMGENPYSGKTYDCTATGTKSTLAACTNYSGYFVKDQMYTYNSATAKYSKDNTTTLNLASTTGTGIGKGLSGNYLNYANMRKVDLIRLILIGGQVDTSKGGVARGSATGGTNVRWLSTDNNKWVEYGTTDPIGLIHKDFDKVRFGLMVFNDNGSNVATLNTDVDGGRISAPLGSTLNTLVAQIESNDTDPGGNTPLAESLYEAMRYFRGTTSVFNSGGVDYGNTTQFPATSPFTRHAIQASCQKHFVLIITDGEPTSDANVPGNTSGATSNITDSNYSGWSSALGANSAANPVPSTLLGQVAYYAHTHNMLDLTRTYTALDNINNLNIFTVYTFDSAGSGEPTLKEAAKFGSFVESPTTANAKPNLASEWSSDGGTTTNNYYRADNVDVLTSNIASALANIIASSASGTAASVANNKSGERGANMIQALFYPGWPGDSTVKWLGEAQAVWYYLDPLMGNSAIYEDTTVDKIFDISNDKLAPANPYAVKALWRAGAKLQATAAADRIIYTMLNTSNAMTDSSNQFTAANLSTTTPSLKTKMLASALVAPNDATLVNYIRGVDVPVYRSRKVSFLDPTTGALNTASPAEWKLGDILNSTPQVQSSVALNTYNTGYADQTYANYISTLEYKNRNVIYAGSNDGLFHAFRLGVVNSLFTNAQPNRIAQMTGTDLGKEEWAFIPSNVLPYIQNQAGVDYCHQCLNDGAPTVADVSIFKHCTATNYYDCDRKTTTTANGTDPTKKNVVTATTSWRTVAVSSMGLGGASRDFSANCNPTTNPSTTASANIDCVKSPVTGDGMSSYYALDVTDPLVPKFMWEFSDNQINAATLPQYPSTLPTGGVQDTTSKGLGLTTAGAAIVRVNSRDASNNPVSNTNGRWFAVMASGPTGTIDSASVQFTGTSDQNLKIYIVDLNSGPTFTQCTSALATNCNFWVKDTGIPFAYANSLNSAAIDLDRWNSTKPGYYSDDVVYVTYTKADLQNYASPYKTDRMYPKPLAISGSTTTTAWTKGGVMRLVINNDPDPYNWFTAPLIDNVGPITTSIGKIQDRTDAGGKLWIFFGEGRYFFTGDETDTRRRIFGVTDPCFTNYGDAIPAGSKTTDNSDINFAMGKTLAACPAVTFGNLQAQDTIAAVNSTADLNAKKYGWYITMDAPSGTAGAERVVTDVNAAFTGVVFYTTFYPNTDPCTPGGNTSLWAVNYKTGGTPPASGMQGKAPVQTSGGGISMIDMASAFTERDGRKLNSLLRPVGMAPKGKFPPLFSPKAVKRIINIQEQ